MKIFGYTLPQLKKAIIAFLTPGVVSFGVALTTGEPGTPVITGAEWMGIIVAMVGTGWLVFANANAPVPAEVAPVQPVG